MKKPIGHKIRSIRKSMPGNLTMEEFGKLFDPPAGKGVISNWENNYNYPNEARLKQLAEFGNTTTYDILYGEDQITEQIKFIESIDNDIGTGLKNLIEMLDEENTQLTFEGELISDGVRKFLIGQLENAYNSAKFF